MQAALDLATEPQETPYDSGNNPYDIFDEDAYAMKEENEERLREVIILSSCHVAIQSVSSFSTIAPAPPHRATRFAMKVQAELIEAKVQAQANKDAIQK